MANGHLSTCVKGELCLASYQRIGFKNHSLYDYVLSLEKASRSPLTRAANQLPLVACKYVFRLQSARCAKTDMYVTHIAMHSRSTHDEQYSNASQGYGHDVAR
eukprot:837639-Pleurochrysis_carterae.AAC.1